MNNVYQWSSTGSAPDGGAFTDFLAKLDDPVFGVAATPSDATGCFAGHCDWRLATVVELQTLQDCTGSPCIDPIFGPTVASSYWSASTTASDPSLAWIPFFSSGGVGLAGKTAVTLVRAVRVGSCH